MEKSLLTNKQLCLLANPEAYCVYNKPTGKHQLFENDKTMPILKAGSPQAAWRLYFLQLAETHTFIAKAIAR